jgi:hypothetical protein
MGKKHFTEEQIAFSLRQTESGTSVAEIIRKLGVSEQTFIGGRSGSLGLASPSYGASSRLQQATCLYPEIWPVEPAV